MAIRQKPIDVGYIRTFARLAQHLNYRVVADELALTQSAISRQIQALEDDVGVRLFRRSTRSVQLTAAGSVLLAAVNSSLPPIDAAVQQLRRSTQRKTVSISTFPSLASLWLIPRLGDFQQLHRDIDIRVDASDALLDLENEGIDLAIREGEAQRMPADASALFAEYATVVVSPLYLQKHGAVHSLADLQRSTWVQVRERGAKPHVTWDGWLQNQGQPTMQPQGWLSFDYSYQAVQAALGGQGAALVRWSMVLEHLNSGALLELWPEKRMPVPKSYWLLHNTAAAQREELHLFIAWLQAQAQSTRLAQESKQTAT